MDDFEGPEEEEEEAGGGFEEGGRCRDWVDGYGGVGEDVWV